MLVSALASSVHIDTTLKTMEWITSTSQWRKRWNTNKFGFATTLVCCMCINMTAVRWILVSQLSNVGQKFYQSPLVSDSARIEKKTRTVSRSLPPFFCIDELLVRDLHNNDEWDIQVTGGKVVGAAVYDMLKVKFCCASTARVDCKTSVSSRGVTDRQFQFASHTTLPPYLICCRHVSCTLYARKISLYDSTDPKDKWSQFCIIWRVQPIFRRGKAKEQDIRIRMGGWEVARGFVLSWFSEMKCSKHH